MTTSIFLTELLELPLEELVGTAPTAGLNGRTTEAAVFSYLIEFGR